MNSFTFKNLRVEFQEKRILVSQRNDKIHFSSPFIKITILSQNKFELCGRKNPDESGSIFMTEFEFENFEKMCHFLCEDLLKHYSVRLILCDSKIWKDPFFSDSRRRRNNLKALIYFGTVSSFLFNLTKETHEDPKFKRAVSDLLGI